MMGAGTVGTLTSALIMWLKLNDTAEKANVVEADIWNKTATLN